MNFKQKREKAEEIVKKYAREHAGTAFVAGQLGGQFGADRIPLTALTVAMVHELCDLYEVNDKAAEAIYVASTLQRITTSGTLTAQTLLNWIPFAGPATNSVISHNLTISAGQDCINAIEHDRLALEEQAKKSVQQITISTSSDLVSDIELEKASSVVEGMTENMQQAVDKVVQGSDFVASHASEINALLADTSLQKGEKELLSFFLNSISKAVLEGKQVDFKNSLKKAFYSSVATCLGRNFTADEIEKLLSKDFGTEIDNICDKYDKTDSLFEKKAIIIDLLQNIKKAYEYIERPSA